MSLCLCGLLTAAAAGKRFIHYSDLTPELRRRLAERGASGEQLLTLAGSCRTGDARCWRALGLGYAVQGRYQEAEAPLHTACEARPKLAGACFDYARVLYLLDRFEAALEALRQEKRSGQVYRIMALSLEALRRTSEAEGAFREAIRLDRNSALNEDPRIDYGVFLFRQGRLEGSLTPLEEAARLRPQSARAHLELGRALLALERLDAALPHLERAVALDPKSARAHLLLGRLLLRLGKAEAAEEHLRQGSRTVK